ncbi:MAG: 5'-nucleotidase [Balneolaceae bacterium]
MRRQLLTVLILLVLGMACTSQETAVAPVKDEISLQQYATEPDSATSALLDKYRSRYDEVMGERIANVARPLEFSSPESSLGNLVADAIRSRASRESRSFVNLALIDEQSFKLTLPEGELTRGDVLQFMPYENHLILLKLRGDQVYNLTQEIASRGGVPVSGLRFKLDGERAQGVLINSGIIDTDKTYWLATSSWIADGGAGFDMLRNPVERVDLDLSIRTLYLDYFKERNVINPEPDGRIRE